MRYRVIDGEHEGVEGDLHMVLETLPTGGWGRVMIRTGFDELGGHECVAVPFESVEAIEGHVPAPPNDEDPSIVAMRALVGKAKKKKGR